MANKWRINFKLKSIIIALSHRSIFGVRKRELGESGFLDSLIIDS
jgi:hypothetical protein